MNWQRVGLGILIALIVLQVIESADERAASAYVALVLAGVAMYNRAGLVTFAGTLQKSLEVSK